MPNTKVTNLHITEYELTAYCNFPSNVTADEVIELANTLTEGHFGSEPCSCSISVDAHWVEPMQGDAYLSGHKADITISKIVGEKAE